MKFLIYFQSYTNTHTNDINYLSNLYTSALNSKDVVGLVIGTRPDTLSDDIISLLGNLNEKNNIFLEIGAETSNDKTLSLLNRNHKWSDVVSAVRRAGEVKIHCGLHLIAGLPGEEKEQILENVREACRLPIETLKIHQLQILKKTPLHRLWKEGKIQVRTFELDEYLDLCKEIIKIVPNHIIIDRFLAQSPPDLVEMPKWGIKNYQFMNLLKK